MALEGSVTLRVTSVQLKQKADEISIDISEMTAMFDALADKISRTSYYWVGEAGDHCRSLYEKDKEKIAEMLMRLKEHPRDLLRMAQIYEEVERKAERISSALPENVIE